MRIVERVAYAARIAAKTFWDEQFQVVTQVDKDGIPTGTTGSPTVTTNAAIGTTTDAPLAGNTTLEDATARTGVSLWKRIVNVLIGILAWFGNNSSNKQVTLIAANTTLQQAVGTYYNGSDTLNWIRLGTYDDNGKAMRGFSAHGLATVPDNAGDSVTVTVYGSNDPHATAASKQPHQTAFYDDRITAMSMATSIVIPRNTAGEIAILCRDFGYEWVYIKQVVAGHDATGCSLFLNTFK